jgi:O-methyltransferase involved in polyketide biosynthesis
MRMVSKSSAGVDNSPNQAQWPSATTAASVSTWCWRPVRGRIRRSMSTSAASVQRPGFAIHDRFVRRAYRFFDEFSSPPRISGIRQIVILAAGLDSRAYRRISYRPVQCDLRNDWATTLRENEFDRSQLTACSAEGLLTHLPPAAQDRLFDTVTALSPPSITRMSSPR